MYLRISQSGARIKGPISPWNSTSPIIWKPHTAKIKSKICLMIYKKLYEKVFFLKSMNLELKITFIEGQGKTVWQNRIVNDWRYSVFAIAVMTTRSLQMRLGSLSERQKFRMAKKVGIGIFSAPKLQLSLCQTKLWLDWH